MKTETIQIMAGAAVLSAVTYVPLLAYDYLGADEFYITLLVAGYAIASFLSSYLFGRAGDIYGGRLVLQVGLLISALSFGLLFITPNLEVLFAVRILNGFAIGMYPGALAAYAYQSKVKMGRFASFGALGWGVGTVFAGIAATQYIYFAFALGSLFFVIAFASAMTLSVNPRVETHVPLFPVETLKKNYPIYLAVLIRHSSAHAMWTLWPLFLRDLGGDFTMIGIVQATNSVSQVIFMAGMTDRLDCRKLISLGLVTTIITFGSFMFVTSIIEILPAQILLGFAWACLYVGALKFVTERNEEKATASGLLNSVMSISGVLGPIYTAILYSFWPSYNSILLLVVIMSTIAFVVFQITSRRLPNDTEYAHEKKFRNYDLTCARTSQ